MGEKRDELLKQIWKSQDIAYELMCEYDSLPHHYGENMLYQAEGGVIDLIAEHPDITITDISNIMRKTPSACSQIVKKLKAKGWVVQTRSAENGRVVNLRLTEEGMKVYRDHAAFEAQCQELTYQKLEDFSEEELTVYLAVQTKINEAYRGDVQRSREQFM